MTLIRKFYDADIQEGGAAIAEEKPSIASLMATKGVMNTSDTMVATPIDIPETKEEPKAQEPTPAATANVETPSEKANLETPSPKVEEPKAVTTPIETPAPVQPTWQEVLKIQQPDTVLKELGFDEKVVGFMKELKDVDPKMLAFLNIWKSNGDVTGYLRELTTDYSKMPAEEVMRHQLRQEYPTASERQIDILFRKEVVEAYNLNSEDDTEREEGQLLLDAKADKYRSSFVQSQNEKLLPKPPEPRAEVPDNTEQLKQQQQWDSYKQDVVNNEVTKHLFQNKEILVGVGEDKVKIPITNPQNITNILFDDAEWTKKLFNVKMNADGTQSYVPNVTKQLIVSAILDDDVAFFNTYNKALKSIGSKEAIEPIDNPSKIETTLIPDKTAAITSPAAAMAKGGRVTQGY